MDLNVNIQGQGYPILALHGHPGSSDSLSVFTDHLSQRFRTLAPDLRGYGKSRPSGSFVLSDHLTDLEALLEKMAIERCIVLGWSLGGILALELVLRHPKRFDGLILIASAAAPRGNHPPIQKRDLALTAIAGIINAFYPGWQWNIDTFGKKSLLRYLISQHTPQAYHYLATSGTSAYLQTSKFAHQALNAALRSGYNRLGDLDKITLPCLILAGENDRHITAHSSLKTAEALPNSHYYCYPNTAHLFPWEIPQQVLKDIDRWLQDYAPFS